MTSGDKKRIDQFYPLAVKEFKYAGVSGNQIEIQTMEGRNRPGRVIIETTKAFFTGSVSHYVINKASGSALWVVS